MFPLRIPSTSPNLRLIVEPDVAANQSEGRLTQQDVNRTLGLER